MGDEGATGGAREGLFDDPAMDRFVSVVLNLASELWVQNEKVANLTALLRERGLASEAEIEGATVSEAEQARREAALNDYVARVFTPLREVRQG